ncbi:sensor histidine kinase [Paenibacillus sp. GCM10027627]|uniref:sensor histidine kinase n=1 Tax=unclassified Paenibacillus TaxID=185978 RepID=UPI00363C0EBD
MKLTSKIHLYSSVLFAVLLIVMNASIYYLFSTLSIRSQLEATEAKAEATAKGMRDAAGKIATADLLRAYVPLDGLIRIVAANAGGKAEGGEKEDRRIISTVTSPSFQGQSGIKAVYSPELRVAKLTVDNISFAHVSVPVIWNDGEVLNIQLTESLMPTMEHLKVLRNVLILVTAAALVPVVLSSRLLANIIMKPITAMTATMRDIQRSGHFKRLEHERESKDELYEMGETFNGMIGLLESNFDKQKRFVSDASHELRTPLTVIESYAKLLMRRGKEKPEIVDESLHAIHSEAVRMKEMTEQLLLLAKQGEQWNVVLNEVDLGALAADSAKAITRAYGREVSVAAQAKRVLAITDENKLKQLLFIFLDNARKYSGEAIAVTVSLKEEQALLTIQDKGIGMAKEELEKVFDRFYRVDEARGRQEGPGGAGLGLSLAKEIADAIGVQIKLDSEVGVGTTVTLVLPAGKGQ